MSCPIRPYLQYKPSESDSLPDVPVHWNIRRLRNAVASRNSGTWGNDPDGINDIACVRVADFDRPKWRVTAQIPTKRAVTESERNQRILRPGDLLLEKSGGGEQQPVGIAILYDHSTEAVCSNFIERIKPTKEHHSEFLTYLYAMLYAKGVNVRSIKQTTGIQNLDVQSYLSETVAIPDLDEQAAIVRYLDHADELINRYIGAKERLIALLEEQRQAVIHQAVTRGLNSQVRSKSSDIRWLGDVPEHWETRALKTICRMKSGDGITAESIEEHGNFPVYGGNGIRGYTWNFTHDGEFVLIGRQGALCGNVHVARGRFWASEHAVVASLAPNNDLNWFAGLLTSMNLNQYSIAAAQPGLSVERVMNLRVPVPPTVEQTAIGEHITKTVDDADVASTKALRQIDLMNEYRTRLIADAVTGQIDVRRAVLDLAD